MSAPSLPPRGTAAMKPLTKPSSKPLPPQPQAAPPVTSKPPPKGLRKDAYMNVGKTGAGTAKGPASAPGKQDDTYETPDDDQTYEEPTGDELYENPDAGDPTIPIDSDGYASDEFDEGEENDNGDYLAPEGTAQDTDSSYNYIADENNQQPGLYEDPDNVSLSSQGSGRRGPLPAIPGPTSPTSTLGTPKAFDGVKMLAGENTLQLHKQKLRKVASPDTFQPSPGHPRLRKSVSRNSTGESIRSSDGEGGLGWSARGCRGSVASTSSGEWESGSGTVNASTTFGGISEEPGSCSSLRSSAILDHTQEGWYFGNISRDVALEKLKADVQNGVFLIRKSSKQDVPYAMSLWFRNKPYHLVIRILPGDRYALGSQKAGELTFISLQDMVQHHYYNEITLSSNNQVQGKCCLTHPPPKSC